MYGSKTKDCAGSWTFQHKAWHLCLLLWCLPGFLTIPHYALSQELANWKGTLDNSYRRKEPFFKLMLSITKFSIVIGSPGAYLSRNRRVITLVSNYRCPIWTFCNWIPVIGYPRDFQVNYVRFDGFLRNVLYSFQNLGKALHTFSLKKEVLRRHL